MKLKPFLHIIASCNLHSDQKILALQKAPCSLTSVSIGWLSLHLNGIQQSSAVFGLFSSTLCIFKIHAWCVSAVIRSFLLLHNILLYNCETIYPFWGVVSYYADFSYYVTNTVVHVFCCTCTCSSLEYVPGSGMAGSWASCVLSRRWSPPASGFPEQLC